MGNVRTVTLELLRHGPAHNQLLSPLTQYLALCGDHAAESITVPFEHQQFLYQVGALRYKNDAPSREFWLTDMARTMGGVLGKATALVAELAESRGAEVGLLDLQLVLSASELALLPFELAEAPSALSGAGQSLQLQPQLPLTITRRVRRVGNPRFLWPEVPRILFAAASPRGVGAIPLEEHLLALRSVIDPWVWYFKPSDAAARRASIEKHLVFLPNASIAGIEQACRTGGFTHVHLLAHGLPQTEAGEGRFGIALHDSRDVAALDVVDGVRLATALRTYRDGSSDALSTPAVVTIASCDAGNVGSVIGAGASVAHALHDAGIPVVVASQFPLSFAGSVLMAQVLYERLLWGGDPRVALSDLRRRLRAKVPDSHDWASIVAYAALPADLDQQLDKVRLQQANQSMDAALNHADRGIALCQSSARGDAAAQQEAGKQLTQALSRINHAKERLACVSEDTETVGLLASAYKREAQVLYQMSVVDQDRSADYRERSEAVLRCSLDRYDKAVTIRISSHWVVVQQLALSAVLGVEDERLLELWTIAKLTAELDLESGDRETVAWAHGSLTELYVLSALFGRGNQPPDKDVALREAVRHARALVRAAPKPFMVYSTKRQFARYMDWFDHVAGAAFKEQIVPIARKVLAVFPETEAE